MNIALNILQQLGGNMFVAMTGAKNLSYTEDALTMHLPKNKAKAKYLRIELTANDTYNMIFRGHDAKTFSFPVRAEFEEVYADQLRNIFTNTTGLLTKI